MADAENALFVKVRVVIDGEAHSVPESVEAVMLRLGATRVEHAHAASGTFSYYALLSSTDATAIASLGDVLTDAKSIGPETGLREIVVEIGRAADLPEGFSTSLRAASRDPDGGGPMSAQHARRAHGGARPYATANAAAL